MGWGGVGWGNNIHWHLHTYVMLRHCTFFFNCHTYVMLRWGGVGWGGAITFSGTYTHTWCYATARSSSTATHTWCYATARSSSTATHTWCYATARSSSTATFIKQLSWFDFGPLQEEKTLRGLSIEKLNPQVRRPLFSVKIDVSLWRNDELVINMWTVKIPPGCLWWAITANHVIFHELSGLLATLPTKNIPSPRFWWATCTSCSSCSGYN